MDCLVMLYFQIEWHMHQKEKKYKLLSTPSVKDPMFKYQWYIVSHSLKLHVFNCFSELSVLMSLFSLPYQG